MFEVSPEEVDSGTVTVTVSEEEGEETVIEVEPLESVEEETETEGVEMLTLAGADSYEGEALMITRLAMRSMPFLNWGVNQIRIRRQHFL